MLVKKTLSVFLLIVGILLILHPLGYGDRRSEIFREVIVMFKAGALQFPKGLDSGSLDQIQILSPQVESILKKHNAEMIMKAFPEFELADTLGFTPDGRPVYLCDLSEIYKIRLPEGVSRDSLIRDLTTLPEAVYAEPNGVAQPAAPVYPNDQLFEQGYQWNLYNYGQSGGTVDADINAPEAWEIFTGSSGVKIGIIDGGVENWHEDLSGKVSGDGGWGWDGHGFHVAGIAAAKTDNETGIAGVDWNVQIISQRIDNTDYEGIYDAIMDAVNAGADVLNNSWGIDYSTTVRLAFANAYKLNRVAVVAMGNHQGSQTQYPAGFGQGIIAVGATDRLDERWSGSNTGNHIDVSAPGVYIMSCVPYQTGWGYYEPKSGTSMATPHVSGLASLLKGYNPDLYNDDIEQIVRISADTVEDMGGQEWTAEYGDGRINVRTALDLLQPPNYLAHWSVSGGYQTDVTDYYIQIFYGVPGLAAGPYYVKRYEVRHDVTFPQPFTSTPHAWGRGAATTGYSAANPNFGMGYCHFVSLTSTGGTLRTWVYQVWTIGGEYIGWKPCAPGNVNFAYTALGQPSLFTPEISSQLVYDGGTSHYIRITWSDSNQCLEGYELWVWDYCFVYEYELPPDCHTYNYYCLLGSDNVRAKVRAFIGDSVFSSWSDVTVTRNAPNIPSDLRVYVHQSCSWPDMLKITPGELPPNQTEGFWCPADSQLTTVPEPGHDPPCFPTNEIRVTWDTPEDQFGEPDYYMVRLLFYTSPPSVFWVGPVYGHEAEICTWENWEQRISVVAYKYGLHSNETEEIKIITTGYRSCYPYSFGKSSPPDEGQEPLADKSNLISDQFSLSQNYPNPFNPETEICYNISQVCHVKLTIYNMLGQKVKVLVNEQQMAGLKTVHWNGKDQDGDKVSSGIYFYRLQAGEYNEVRKMILMK